MAPHRWNCDRSFNVQLMGSKCDRMPYFSILGTNDGKLANSLLCGPDNDCFYNDSSKTEVFCYCSFSLVKENTLNIAKFILRPHFRRRVGKESFSCIFEEGRKKKEPKDCLALIAGLMYSECVPSHSSGQPSFHCKARSHRHPSNLAPFQRITEGIEKASERDQGLPQ